MSDYYGFIDLCKNKEEAPPGKELLCPHSIAKELCDKCFIKEELYRLKPIMDSYKIALENINSRKSITSSGEVKEKDVWKHHTDFKVPPNFKIRQEALAMKYYVADIRFKRNVRLSYGVFFNRGMVGYLLDDNCVVDALKCVYEDSLRNDHMELIERGKKNNHKWIFANGFLALIPQIEVKEKFSKKLKKNVIEEKINYVIKK